MQVPLGQRRLLTAGGLLLAFLLLGWSAPHARASCGHYVTVAGQGFPTLEKPANPEEMPYPGPAPCKGPSCSRGPIAPTPASATPSTPSAPDWAWAVAPPATFAGPGRPVFLEDPSSPPAPCPLGVFHPPRA